ncbi:MULTISPECIES: hypothetical protein [Mycolicibacter]|uniref:Secreted protein n=2 Tax=Mycolicibacter TaxID=1073531 RepID=A0A7I9YCK5_MYCAL|nr:MULTISPECIES: hypothetical protein [Mycolicibacter]GFG68418.1 hypothetical protein MSEN_01380 [Mycolicibacter senuensis]GFG86272.1 hypothetical protein MALGJ_29480 [Mycolicibacter algericus]
MKDIRRLLGPVIAAIPAWAALGFGFPTPSANADSGTEPSGCYSSLPWAVCNQPWNNYPPGSWSFNPGPRQWGPQGYVPCMPQNGCDG